MERLSKESAKNDAYIKRQEEHIAKLLKKLEKVLGALYNKGASGGRDEKGFNRSEASNDNGESKKGDKLQNGSSSNSMIAEQI